MRPISLLLAIALVVPYARDAGTARGSPLALAGWYGVFAGLPGYQRSFLVPVRSATAPRVYRHTARYRWTGDADRTWDVTLARDPAFAGRYTADAVRSPAQSVRIGMVHGWRWEYAASDDRTRVRIQLVVPLAADRALILEGRGLGPWDDPVALAVRFNLGKMTTALLSPPRTDFRRTLATFRVLKVRDSFDEVLAWAGMADADIGSGIHVLIYGLGDGSRVLLGFPDLQRMLYAKHQLPDGSVESLAP